MVMVLRAGKHSNVGGHIATYQSAAVMYDVGFDHFFRGRTDEFDGDMVYIQGHSAPGIYGRAFIEGRIDEAGWIISAASPIVSACRRIRIRA